MHQRNIKTKSSLYHAIVVLFFRTFKIYDDDESKSLQLEEFKKGILNYGITEMNTEEMEELFEHFDVDGSGSIKFDDFLTNLRVRVLI